MMKLIYKRFTNIHRVKLVYDMKEVDNHFIDEFISMVSDLELKSFELMFGKDLKNSSRCYSLIRTVNKMIKN